MQVKIQIRNWKIQIAQTIDCSDRYKIEELP
jgi:hypothetical protein